MDNQFIKRLKSFGWRLGAYLLSITLAWLINNIASLELSPFITTFIGLILGEASKMWANYQKTLGRSFLGMKI